jgi:hypothetical protein
MVFGRVVSSEIASDYQAEPTPGGYEVGPMRLHLSDGTTLDLGASTYIHNACANIPIPGATDDEPCFVVASLDPAGSIVAIRVLSFQRLHEGDALPTLFTTVDSIASASNSQVTIDDGIALTADASELRIDCDARTLEELVGLTPAGFILILDTETGLITGVECTESF